MQDNHSHNYFEKRAQEEREAAERAADERAAQSHRELASHYENISSGLENIPGDDADELADGSLPKDFRILP